MKIAIVLGNRLNDDGTPSDLLKKRIELLNKANNVYDFDKIILSGGVANTKAVFSEAYVMSKMVLSIDSSKIILEDKSLSTVQNALFSVPIALSLGADEIVVITSAEHMNRFFLNPKKIFAKQLKNTNIKLNFYCDWINKIL